MIAKGQKLNETAEFKQYLGFANCNILAVNPTKEELEKILGTEIHKDIEYLSTKEYDGVAYATSRISFYVKPKSTEDIPVMNVSFMIQDRYVFNKDKTKVQVIDKYGRTAWVTVEDSKEHKIPLDKNGNKLRIDADYRPCYVGEDNLTKFIKAYMKIPNTEVFNPETQKYEERKDLDMCLIRLDNMVDLIKGNVKEIKDAVLCDEAKDKLVKVMFAVKMDAQGRLFQSFYPEEFLPGDASKRIQDNMYKRIVDRKTKSDLYSGLIVDENPIHEYVINAEKIFDNPNIPANQKSKEDDLPF